MRVLGEIDQILPDISKTRWRKKSDFYTLFAKLAKHAAQLPLPANVRMRAVELLETFALKVDQMTRGDGIDEQHVRDYVKNVERASSDLGARRERERVLDELLSAIFT